MDYRIEKDLLGEMIIDNDRYYGINTARAMENFNITSSKTNILLIREIGTIKKAAARVNKKLKNIDEIKADAIIKASQDVIDGKLDNEFNISSLQGGAGTSTNMNVNEVIANKALEYLGKNKGEYEFIHPLNHVNMCQSTNDVYPTALRIASIKLIRGLALALASLQEALQIKENELSSILRLGRTELMDALPMLVGQGFGAYAQAIARDRWRIYKVEERLRSINLGGTAIGTGMNAPMKYIFMITDEIQKETGLGLSRSEFPMDITQNADVFVEVSGLLKAVGVNIIKISRDLSLLASGPRGGFGEISLPPMQAGSTIMPGKINPVIPEMMAQISMKVMANDGAITMAASMGQLELNPYMPLISENLLESLQILKDGVLLFKEKCIEGIVVNEERCNENIEKSAVLATALVNHLGYDKASVISKKAIKENKTIREVVIEGNYLTIEEVDKILNILELTKPGIPGT